MSVDELAVLDGGKCILQLRGVRPFLSNKYDLTKHPLYRYTADYDQIRWNAVCGESCTHGVEPGKSWRSYQMLTYGYLVLNLRA